MQPNYRSTHPPQSLLLLPSAEGVGGLATPVSTRCSSPESFTLDDVEIIARPPTPTYTFMDLSNRTRFRVPTHGDVMEYSRIRLMSTHSELAPVFTTIEDSAIGQPRRICVHRSPAPSQPYQQGQRVRAFGTLQGEWVLGKRQFIKGTSVYVDWTNDTGDIVVVSMPEDAVAKPPKSKSLRAKTIVRVFSLSFLR